MDTIFYYELKKKCAEIKESTFDTKLTDRVIEAYERILHFYEIGRREGFLAMEEAAENLDRNDDTQELFHTLIMMIVDGMEPALVEEAGLNKCLVLDLPSYDGLINLIYYRAVLMIQAGDTAPYGMKIYLKSMLPKVILQVLEQRERENAQRQDPTERERDMIKKLCMDNTEIDPKDCSVVNQTALMILMLSDKAMQRLLRDTDTAEATVAMKALPGKVREKFFDNMSPRLGTMVARDMEYMGQVRIADAEAACVSIMKTFIKLEENGEIAHYDTTTVKSVIDIYESAQDKNAERKDENRE